MRLHILSLGAGVQSSTIAMMAAHGEITPMPDCAIFADTHSEPAAVYRQLDWLGERLPFPIHRVSVGSLREQILLASVGQQRMNARPPFFTGPNPTNGDKRGGMLRRQCTSDFKLVPIMRKVRELIGLCPRQRWPKEILVEQWIGISLDEAHRMKPAMTVIRRTGGRAPHPTIVNRWPLIELRMTRRQCLAWMNAHGYPEPPKSACTFCPYHDDAAWRQLRDSDPAAWVDAIRVDSAIRGGVKDRVSKAEWFLHRSCRPLDEVDLSIAKDRHQVNLFGDECEGLCGL